MVFTRLCGVAALAFVPIVVAATAIVQSAGPPEVSAGAESVAAFYAGHAAQIGTASALAPLAWLLLAVFGAGAVARIWPVEQARGEAWSLVGLAGLLMQNAVFAGSVAAQVGLLADPSATGLWGLHNALFELNGIALAIALLGFSVGGLRTATLRPWHGAVGLGAAGLQLASAMLTPLAVSGGPAGFAVIGLVGFLLWLVWLITFGVVLLRDRPQSDRPSTGAPMPAVSAN